MDALINKFSSLLYEYNDILKTIYYNPSLFYTHANKFQKDLENNARSFRIMKFPFSGLVFLKKAKSIIETIPELVCSIIELGLDKLLVLEKTLEFDSLKQVLLSKDTVNESSAILNNTLDLINDFKFSPQTLTEIENKILDNIDLLKIDRVHTDLSGCLQVIHEKFVTYINNPSIQTNERITDYPISPQKGYLLDELVKPFTKPINTLDNLIVLTVKDEENNTQLSKTQPKNENRLRIELTPKPGGKNNRISINENNYIEVQNFIFDFLYYLFRVYKRNPTIVAKIDFYSTITPEHIYEMIGNDSTYSNRFDYAWNTSTNKRIKLEKSKVKSMLNTLLKKEPSINFDVISNNKEAFILTKMFQDQDIVLNPFN